MIFKVKHIIYVAMLLISQHIFGQQDLSNTLFTQSLSLYNPAVASMNNALKVAVMNRSQWNGLEGAPKLQALYGKTGLINKQHGFAFNLVRSSAGIQNKLDLNLQYAYSLKLNKNKLNVGLNFSGRRFTNDFTDDRLIALDGFTIDPSIERIKYSRSIFNLGIGLMLESDRYYIGLSVPRFLSRSLGIENAINLSKEVRHYHFISGGSFDLNKQWKFLPALHYKQAVNSPFNLDVQGNFSYQDNIQLGLNIKSGGGDDVELESIGFIFGLKLNKAIKTVMAYDFNLTDLRRQESGSFELILIYQESKGSRSYKVQNPRFY